MTNATPAKSKPKKPKPCCRRAPMAGRTACGKLTSPDSSSDWSRVDCPACLAKQVELALSFAHYCGTEYEANLDNSQMREYLDDIAGQFGAASWTDLAAEHKKLSRVEFDRGRVDERKARRG